MKYMQVKEMQNRITFMRSKLRNQPQKSCQNVLEEILWLILASIYILGLMHIIKLWASEVLLYFCNHK